MRVVISGYVGKKITGIGRNLVCLLDNSSSQIHYVLYTNIDMKDDFHFKNQNVEIKTYKVSKNSSMKNLLWTTFVFPFVTLKEKADRVLIPNFTLLLFKFKPTIVIMHDLIEFNVPDKFSKLKMFYRTKLADPITAKRADKIITVSKNSKKDIVHFLGVSNNKITVIYNGVDRVKFKKLNGEKANDIIGKKNWPNDFLLYAGTIDHPGKNVMGVIKAFEKLRDEHLYQGNLILAGMPGSNHEAVEKYISHSKYKNNIILTGFVTDEELIALYSTCKAFIFISLYEGFGIPPLEALSCGAKTIVSNSSSLPEVVGDVGWKVDPLNEDEVEKTVFKAMQQSFGEKEIKKIDEHLKKYDWEQLSNQLEKVLVG